MRVGEDVRQSGLVPEHFLARLRGDEGAGFCQEALLLLCIRGKLVQDWAIKNLMA